MKNIDITNWKEFKIKDLFDILSGVGITKREIFDHPGNLPAIQGGKEKNGLIGLIDEEYCKSKKYRISNGMCLTVARSGSSGFVAYQPSKCVVGDSAKILQPKFDANKEKLIFLRVILMVNMKKYAYIDKVTSNRYMKDMIKLPVLNDGKPDWAYMENQIRIIETRISDMITLLLKPRELHLIDSKHWRSFKLGDLFDIKKGTRLTRANMISGEINFIGASSNNNGITARIGNTERLHPANTITVNYNGSVGEAFYQSQRFWASDDVNVLYPKFKLNPSIAFFFLPVIRQKGKQYAFIDKWEKETMEKDEILLPSKDGQPDWEYMEDYIKAIGDKVNRNMTLISHEWT